MRKQFLIFTSLLTLILIGLSIFEPLFSLTFIVWAPLLIAGYHDYLQTSQAIKRNFPLLGRFRYLFESIRPEINQYFVESNSDGVPFSREQRSVVYQRAKGQMDTLPFGTQQDVYAIGYEWVAHSLAPTHIDHSAMRVTIGSKQCKMPYSASLLNISAMSYGSLSQNAILALNGGAKDGGFAHNTGEGGLSPYHLQNGGDLIWQIGTGYFSCRTQDGKFSPEKFQEGATKTQVKMIEIKLSQGAKPSHGGILPGKKVNQEIASIRGVTVGKDVISPPAHSAFSTPIEMMHFIQKLRDLSGGKPIGIKLALGKRSEFIAICKAIIKTGITPDYIAVDGGEGGTGAAPLEFSNYVGYPGTDALIFVHNALTGFGLRDQVKIITSGKVTTGFGMLKKLALGADLIYCARGMLLALGCIQALRCNSNSCPTGVATQDPHLVAGLAVSDKRKRVTNFQRETIDSLRHLLEAMGLPRPDALRPSHLLRRMDSHDVKNYSQIFSYLSKGQLLKGPIPKEYVEDMESSHAESFGHPLGNARKRDLFKRAS